MSSLVNTAANSSELALSGAGRAVSSYCSRSSNVNWILKELWRAGAPIDISPTKDDPALGADPNRNDNFRYAFPGDQQTQDRCPFAAHTRKTNPRADLGSTEPHRIIRSGIPFGPEVSADEAASGKTHSERGLLFVAYQSNIANGFEFIQECRLSVWS